MNELTFLIHQWLSGHGLVLRTFGNFAEDHATAFGPLACRMGMNSLLATMNAVVRGVPNFFVPNPTALFDVRADVGVEAASYYSAAPLHETFSSLVDSGPLRQGRTRLTVGAVNARSGEMPYFDSRNETVSIDHVMASGALPPAFPAVRIEGEPYGDGGIYSNTPIEAVLDCQPRRDSVIFAVFTAWRAGMRRRGPPHASAPKPFTVARDPACRPAGWPCPVPR